MCPGIIAGEGRKFDGFGAGESWRLGLGADRGLLPRGIPGLGAAPPRGRGRGPPGRSSEDRIPCWGAKGLLPGRGAPGRGAGRGAGRGVAAPFGLNGLLPGRGAGFFPEPPGFPGLGAAPGRGVGAAGFGLDWDGLGASGAWDACSFDFCAVGSVLGPAVVVFFWPGLVAGFFAGADGLAAGFLGAGFWAGLGLSSDEASSLNSAFSRFTTGGSMVDDAEETNSPMSSNLARASFEVIPSCLATSWTRSFATTLLFWTNRGGGRVLSASGFVPSLCGALILGTPRQFGVVACCVSMSFWSWLGTHRVLTGYPSDLRPAFLSLV